MMKTSKSGIFGTPILMPTGGKSFDTVMAALASNKCSQCNIAVILARVRAEE